MKKLMKELVLAALLTAMLGSFTYAPEVKAGGRTLYDNAIAIQKANRNKPFNPDGAKSMFKCVVTIFLQRDRTVVFPLPFYRDNVVATLPGQYGTVTHNYNLYADGLDMAKAIAIAAADKEYALFVAAGFSNIPCTVVDPEGATIYSTI